jgi:hypothetical protein
MAIFARAGGRAGRCAARRARTALGTGPAKPAVALRPGGINRQASDGATVTRRYANRK